MKKLLLLAFVSTLFSCKKDGAEPQATSTIVQYQVSLSSPAVDNNNYFVKLTYKDNTGQSQTITKYGRECTSVTATVRDFNYGSEASATIESNFVNVGYTLTGKIVLAENEGPVTIKTTSSTSSSFSISSIVSR